MANRSFTQYRYSLEKAVVDLFMHVTFGASGAPTLDVANSKGIKSISRTSAGLYVITLQDSYTKFLRLSHIMLNATAPAAPASYVVSQAVTNGTTPTITFQFNATGTPTDPGNGEQAYFNIVLGNSSAI